VVVRVAGHLDPVAPAPVFLVVPPTAGGSS
jgi:hypothetical protein